LLIVGAKRYAMGMSKHMLDLDEDALLHARLTLGAETFSQTVNEALRRVIEQHNEDLETRLNLMAGVRTFPQPETWSSRAA
jgi:Arc/MetJ family transcription regulator